MTILMPSYLHDVFGESQTIGELLVITLFGFGFAAYLFFEFPEMTRNLPRWRSAVALLLIADIAAGSVANFTRSTNDHYCTDSKKRLLFIALHVHILILACLLETGHWDSAVTAWGYTIPGAFAVNALRGNEYQKFVAGVLLVLGISIAMLRVDDQRYFSVISLLFMVKVLFAFAVDHYGGVKKERH